MNVQYLIQLLNNKLTILSNAKVQAYLSGDLPTINSLDQEILDTQNTLAQLNLVQQLANEAAASNTTSANLVASGIASNQAADVIPDNPTAVLASYNMAIYAADPLYIQKLTDILENMPAMDTTQQIDAYIADESIGSPLTGAVILGAAQQYNIDTRLLCAILELESNFGTAGVAVSTLNPGNVGNTGAATRTYNSWADGVAAVAKWLSVNPAVSAPITNNTTTTNTDTSITATTAATTPNPNDFTSQPVTASPTTSAPTTSATSTNVTSTTTPDNAASSTTATSTVATSTPDSSDSSNATSTNATSTPVTASSTPTIAATSTNATATSTDDTSDDSSDASSTIATSTNATSTPPGNILNASSTPTLDDSSTSSDSTSTTTPSTNASSTAMRIVPIRRRRV